MRIRTYAFGMTLGLMLMSLANAKTIIHAGTLIDGRSDRAREQMSIVIEGERITSVESGFIEPGSGDTLIDLSGQTVMPGFMDMHVHLDHEHHEDYYIEKFQLEPADYAIKAVAYANETLLAGFTTVRNLGDKYNVTIALRDAINDGTVAGPRIYSAGKSLATTGGHADPTNGWTSAIAGDPGPKQGVVNSPADARKAVRQRYKDGADLIKITATGGVLSVAKSGQNPQFTPEELEAIIETANDYGFHVAAHAHGTEGMKRAVVAGVRSIEHGTYMTDEVMELLKEHGVFYVPTISAGVWVGEKAEIDGFFPELVRPKAAAIGPVISDTFKKAYESGVKIAFGTDSGVSGHGDNATEFQYMVEGGMSPMEAIQSATTVAAELLGIEDELGSIEAGKIADIVAVGGGPLADVSVLQNIDFVMKDGTVYKQ